MNAPFSGGCSCGSIRYVCARVPVAMLNCHCLLSSRRQRQARDSQRLRGLWCAAIYAWRSCSRIHVDSFSGAGPSEFAPMLDIWTSSAQSWVCLSQEIPHYPESPNPGEPVGDA